MSILSHIQWLIKVHSTVNTDENHLLEAEVKQVTRSAVEIPQEEKL